MEIPQKSIYTPKTANEHYKAGEEELDNPKYFCIECEKPLYSNIMLTVLQNRKDTYLIGGLKPPTKFWYVCTNKDCNQEMKEYPIIVLQNRVDLAKIKEAIVEIKSLFKKGMKNKKIEEPESTEE